MARLVADARGVIDRRGDALVEWGPEARAWEARLWAELLRWRWAADVDPPSHDELLNAWREAVDRFETYGAPYELAAVRARFASLLTATGDLDEAREQAAAIGRDRTQPRRHTAAVPASGRSRRRRLARRSARRP